MILTCPSCGATASACAWENDITAREAMQAIIALPPPAAKVSLGYLSLFRPEQRALTWRKAKKTVDALAALIAPGYVQVQGKPARPCPPQLWAMGMEQMIDRAPNLQRPMKNHNYLRQIVWQIADQADAHREQQGRRHELTGATKSHRPTDDEMSQAMRAYIEEHGEPAISQPMADSIRQMVQRMKEKQGGSHDVE